MSRINHKKSRKLIQKDKKAFIASALVDFYAYFVFIIIVIIFALLFKWSAKQSMDRLTGFKGVTWSGYLAAVYLRTPVEVQGVEMSMAELIALYDYNQTIEREQELKKNKDVFSPFAGLLDAMKKLDTFAFGNLLFRGKEQPLAKGIRSITDSFIEDNFDAFNTCYYFAIEGNGFEMFAHGSISKCGFTAGNVNIDDLKEKLEEIPKESYLTYIPAIDPRKDPIKLYVIYDMDKVLKMKGSDTIYS